MSSNFINNEFNLKLYLIIIHYNVYIVNIYIHWTLISECPRIEIQFDIIETILLQTSRWNWHSNHFKEGRIEQEEGKQIQNFIYEIKALTDYKLKHKRNKLNFFILSWFVIKMVK